MSFLDLLARAVGYKSSQQPRRADPEFMGDALVYNFLFDRFRLKDDDFSRLTAKLPPDLKKPAKLWVVIYGTWLFREALRAKYGNEFVKEALLAARQRLDRKIEGFEEYDGAFFVHALDFWFAQLDDATQGVGTKIQGVELPFELFAAWNFLTLDGDSPFFRQTSIPDHIDLTVADCLEQGKSAILRFIKFAVEIGGPVPTKAKDVTAVVDAAVAKIVREENELRWSSDPGPEERHLRRRQGNLLFPARQRAIAQVDIDTARVKDQKEIFLLVADYRRTLEKVLASPDILSMDASRELLEELESLKAGFVAHATEDASKWLDSIEEKGINTMVAAMRQSLSGNETALRQFDKWRQAAAKRDQLVNGPALAEIGRIDAADVIPTLCSLDIDDMAHVLTAIACDESAAAITRSACIQVLRDAVSEGYPSADAIERLRVLGVGAL